MFVETWGIIQLSTRCNTRRLSVVFNLQCLPDVFEGAGGQNVDWYWT